MRDSVFGKISKGHLGPYSNIFTWVVSGESGCRVRVRDLIYNQL